MKLSTFLVFVCCIGFISYVIAGPGSAGGPGAQLAPVDNAVVAPVKVSPALMGPGSSSSDQSGQATASTAANASASSQNVASDSSSTGRNASSNGFQHENANAASNFIGRGQEKVVEISAKDLAAETTGSHEKSEVSKKFEPSILDAGIDQAANPKASPKNPVTGAALFAPIDPVTGVTIPPPSVPIPHTMVPEQAPAVPGINPIPSATVSSGINLVPSATVTSLPQAIFAPIDPVAGATIPAASPIPNGMAPQ